MELTQNVWHDGLYHTGDVAWRDEDGYYWFEGRIDDVIKSSGYRIGPFEVESALMTHEAVVECAITGVPDEVRGMVVKATVVLARDWKDKVGDVYLSRYGLTYDEVLTTTEFDLNTPESGVQQGNNLGDLVADAFLWAVENLEADTLDAATVSVTADGVLRAPLRTGSLTTSQA